MNRRNSAPWLIAPALLALGPAVLGQSTNPNVPPNQSATLKDEPVVLSPFQVGSETERGYQSTAILQGGRGKIDLADVAGQVAVFTKEFLDDIGATNTDEALLFSATTHTHYDNANGNGDPRPGSRDIAEDA